MPIVIMPDGARVSFPDDMPKQQIAGLIASKFPRDTGKDLGENVSAVQGFNATVPFGERAVAGIGAAGAKVYDATFGDNVTEGKSIGDLYNEARGNQKATSAANPNAYLAGALGGAATTLPIGFSKAVANPSVLGNMANALNKGSSTIGNFIRGGEVAKDASILAKIGNVGLQGVKSAAVAAPIGAIYGYGGSANDLDTKEALQDAASTAGLSSAVAGALPVIGAGAGAAIGSLAPKIDEGLIDVVKAARDRKIPVAFDQATSSRPFKAFQKNSQDLPFSGQQGFREKQLRALQRNLFGTLGIEGVETFTPKTMAKAFSKVGGEFDELTKGKQFSIGNEFIDNIVKKEDEVASLYGKEAADTFKKEALKVVDDFRGDSITGDVIARQRARVNALARRAGDNNKEALLELESAIIDGITGGDEAARAALSKAKQRYKNLIVLEPVANKSRGGFISPSLLNNRVSQVYGRAHTVGNSGEIGELARIAHELMPDLGGSDTAGRIQMGAAGLAGMGYAPTTTSLLLGANRGFQSGVNRNQNLIDKALAKELAKAPVQAVAESPLKKLTEQNLLKARR